MTSIVSANERQSDLVSILLGGKLKIPIGQRSGGWRDFFINAFGLINTDVL